MITKPTVLVLGAGASVPYDYPTGLGLKKLVVEALRSQKSDRVDRLLLNLERPRTPKEVAEFGKALHESRIGSVDAFLECEGNREDVEIGKRAIAQVLGARERSDVLVNTTIDNGNWYAWLFERMADCPFDQFGENALTVITFNYDRSWEQFLYDMVNGYYNHTDDETVIGQLCSLRVIHLYGCLGRLWWQGDQGGSINYGEYHQGSGQTSRSRLIPLRMARGIKILPEADKTSREFQEAHQALLEAARIYFLGFGYGQRNLARLFPPDILDELDKRGTVLNGTSYDFPASDYQRVSEHFRERTWISEPQNRHDIVDFLKTPGAPLD